jgi:hypothetical protein
MFLLDSFLVGGLRFVLQRVADVADRELHDPERWREALLQAQQDLETGAITPEAFATREREILDRLRDLQPGTLETGPGVVAHVEVFADVGDRPPES